MMPAPAFAPAPLRRTALANLHPAVRLVGLILGAVMVFVLPPAALPLLGVGVVALLAGGGLPLRLQARALRPWWSVGLLVLVVHTLTTTSAAPLGRPSWSGALAGVVALARVGVAAGFLALLVRSTNLDEMAGALRWWLTPLRRLGLRDDDLPLVLAVALGTAPSVLGEARRIEAVVRLRRSGPAAAGRRPWRRRVVDRGRVVVPLLESLARRADALSLALRRRRPAAPDLAAPAPVQLAGLALWTTLLVVAGGIRWGGAW